MTKSDLIYFMAQKQYIYERNQDGWLLFKKADNSSDYPVLVNLRQGMVNIGGQRYPLSQLESLI